MVFRNGIQYHDKPCHSVVPIFRQAHMTHQDCVEPLAFAQGDLHQSGESSGATTFSKTYTVLKDDV